MDKHDKTLILYAYFFNVFQIKNALPKKFGKGKKTFT